MTVSQTKVTLTAGSSFNVGVSTSPASYASLGYGIRTSNSKVASISGKKVTAAGGGTCTITIWPLKAPNIQKTISVTVVPKAPSGLKASMAAYNRVSLTWNASAACDGYLVFKQEAGGSPKGRAQAKGRTNTSYTDIENSSAGIYLKPGVKYRYYVRAYFEVGGVKYFSDPSNIREVTPALQKETAAVRTYTGLYNTVVYNRIPGADGYVIYRRDNGGAWIWRNTRVGNAPVMFKDTYKIRYLTQYQYRVIPYRRIDGKVYAGTYACSGTLVSQPAATYVTKLNRTPNGIQIVWNPQKSCSGYQIYRREINGQFTRIRTITDPNRYYVTDTKVNKGTTYQYYVVAYKTQFYKKSIFGYRKVSNCITW